MYDKLQVLVLIIEYVSSKQQVVNIMIMSLFFQSFQDLKTKLIVIDRLWVYERVLNIVLICWYNKVVN